MHRRNLYQIANCQSPNRLILAIVVALFNVFISLFWIRFGSHSRPVTKNKTKNKKPRMQPTTTDEKVEIKYKNICKYIHIHTTRQPTHIDTWMVQRIWLCAINHRAIRFRRVLLAARDSKFSILFEVAAAVAVAVVQFRCVWLAVCC